MKLFVQARKDGYNILYPKTTPAEFYQFASDLRPIAKMGVSFLGKKIYSIAFSSGGCIFTKHIIVQDVQRESLGNVGFSIYVPNEKKLLGIEVKSLVDELIETYRQNYCADYYLNNKQVDWILFQSLADDYDKKLTPVSAEDVDNFESENNEEAYVYYDNDSELCRYFDDPFQEMYIPYKQIFFVDRNLEKMADNPLNALKYDTNANLTGKIDLENPKYKLLFNSQANGGVSITIKANGSIRSNKNKIRRKDDLEITWKKHYYNTEIQQGKCFEISSEFIKVDPIEHTVTVKEIELKEEEKNINLEIKDRKGVIVYNAEIYVKSNYQEEKRIYGNSIILKGNELGERWVVRAEKGDRMFTDNRPIDIEKDCIETIKLILKERKIVKIIALDKDSGDIISNFKVWVQGKINTKTISEITFEDNEIDKQWNITIESDNYQRTDSFSYDPKNGENILVFKLKRNQKYFNKEKDAQSSKGSNNLDNENIDEKSTFSKPKVIARVIVGVLILGLGIWSLVIYLTPDKTVVPINTLEIQEYLEGDALILDTLNTFKTKWEKQNPEHNEEEGVYSLLWPFNKETNSALQQNDWEQTSKSLDSAITKREFVDNKNFAALIKLRYSSKQQQFKNVITKIDSSKYEDVKNKLGDISPFNLDRIADSINFILNKTSNENLKKQEEERAVKNLIEQKPETKQASPPSSKKIVITKPNEQVSASDKTISRQLKSSSISKNQLSEYKEKFPTDKAIQLYLDFWKIITSNDKNDFDELLKKINNNNILKNSELKKFLNTICKNEDEFNEFRSSSGRAKFETLDKLKANVK